MVRLSKAQQVLRDLEAQDRARIMQAAKSPGGLLSLGSTGGLLRAAKGPPALKAGLLGMAQPQGVPGNPNEGLILGTPTLAQARGERTSRRKELGIPTKRVADTDGSMIPVDPRSPRAIANSPIEGRPLPPVANAVTPPGDEPPAAYDSGGQMIGDRVEEALPPTGVVPVTRKDTRAAGLLADPSAPRAGGLLAEQPREDRWRSVRNGLSDFLFGGEPDRLAAERRQRDRAERLIAVRDEAFAAATAGGAFDPNVFAQRVAAAGLSLDQADITALEGITDSQNVRAGRDRQERREVTAGALAPLAGLSGDALSSALPGTLQYLEGQGFSYGGALDPQGLAAAIGAGMGANAYLDNDRGERALAESIRSAQAGERYRDQEQDWRQSIDSRDFDYQKTRDQADDSYRNSRAQAEDAYRRWQMENDLTRSDIEGRVLRKAIEQGVTALTPEEKAVYDRAVALPTASAPWGAPPVGPPTPAGNPAPQPVQPQSIAASPLLRPPGYDIFSNVQSGQSQDNPARPQSEQEFEALPVGAWFVNPADGRTMQKAR